MISMFAPLADCERYVTLVAADVEHGEDCPGPATKYSAAPAESVSATQWTAYTTILRAAAEIDGATVTVQEHRGWCDAAGCSGGGVSRYSALVSVEWHGRRLSREYALPDA